MTPQTSSGKPRQGLALCLSGGGFRASLFHLGSLRYLHETGVLERVDTLSTVSGGSILSGYLAGLMISSGMTAGLQFSDWERCVADGFRKQVAGRDLRTWPVLAHLPWNWAMPRFRAAHVAARLKKRLTPARLRELPERPEFVFCASDLVFGVNWTFRRDKSGDYMAGNTPETACWPIARAVGCSASFPPIFGPVPLGLDPTQFKGGSYRGRSRSQSSDPRVIEEERRRDREAMRRRLCLSDGGVYDNMGMEPAWKSHECVLVSDCGAPFQFEEPGNYVRRILRITGVVMNQAAAVRKRAYFADIDDKHKDTRPPLYRGGYWGIGGVVKDYKDPADSIEGYSQSLVEDVIRRVRTDLDRFTLAEMKVLENHGYSVTAAVMRRRRPDLLGDADAAKKPAPPWPHPEWRDENRVKHAMRDSHNRVSLARLFSR